MKEGNFSFKESSQDPVEGGKFSKWFIMGEDESLYQGDIDSSK